MTRTRIIVPIAMTIGLVAASAVGAAGQSGDGARAPMPSAACGAGVTADPGQGQGSVEIAGEMRAWRSFVPSAHDGSTPLPLIIWLHGQGMSMQDLEDVTDLKAFGEEQGIIIVSPDGHQPDWGWMWEPGRADIELSTSNRDVAFIDTLIDQLGSELCLDLARVYGTGYSMGGHGAAVLACALSDRIAAVAPAPMFSNLGEACQPERSVPMLAFHQTDDDVVYFEGGFSDFLEDQLPWGTTKGQEPFFQRPDWSASVVERATAIAERHGCDGEPATSPIADGVDHLSWGCPVGADVGLIVVQGGGHDWMMPTDGVDTNEIMWEFLSRFSLPG